MGLGLLIATPFQCHSQKSKKYCYLSVVQLEQLLLHCNVPAVYHGRNKGMPHALH